MINVNQIVFIINGFDWIPLQPLSSKKPTAAAAAVKVSCRLKILRLTATGG
jgi:hypothetical protein